MENKNKKILEQIKVDKNIHVYCPNCSTYMGMNVVGDTQLVKHLNSNACATFINERSKPMTTKLNQENNQMPENNVSEQVNELLNKRETENENDALKVDNARYRRDLQATQKALDEFENQPKGHTDLIELASCETCGDKALKTLDKKGGAFLHPEFAKKDVVALAKKHLPQINQSYKIPSKLNER